MKNVITHPKKHPVLPLTDQPLSPDALSAVKAAQAFHACIAAREMDNQDAITHDLTVLADQMEPLLAPSVDDASFDKTLKRQALVLDTLFHHGVKRAAASMDMTNFYPALRAQQQFRTTLEKLEKREHRRRAPRKDLSKNTSETANELI